MNSLITNHPTMNTLELRALINKARKEFGEPEVENSHFLKRVEDELDGELGKRKVFVNPEGGRPTGFYSLSIDQCLLVGMRESKSVRRSVLEELKKRQSSRLGLPDFNNPVEAARAWANEVEKKQALQVAYQEAKPSVDFVEKYVDSTGLMGVRMVCKTLKAKENAFVSFLEKTRIMYRLSGKLMAYQNHIDAGRFLVKTGVNKVNGYAFTDCLFTPKGVRWIAGEWAKFNIQMDF